MQDLDADRPLRYTAGVPRPGGESNQTESKYEPRPDQLQFTLALNRSASQFYE
jgi:hypothetical protein